MFEPVTIMCALACGMLARSFGLPSLLGYLAAGFVLYELGTVPGPMIAELSDLGVTLLLFSIGLKLRPAELLEPKVWGSTLAHMLLTIGLLTPLLLVASSAIQDIDLTLNTAVLIAFALSFSSTVFAIQVLQSRGEMASRHATLSIGVLLIQDVAAVLYIAAATGKLPQPSALLLLLLIPARPLIIRLLKLAGHEELFTLCGLALAIGGADVFELVGIKGDLGALILGAMLAGHKKGKELAKNLLQFKDLFLVGFFVSIGLSGWPYAELAGLAILLGLLVPLKSPLYFWLMTRLHTPPRTAMLSAAALSNHSEFGLIVIAIATKQGIIGYEWSAALSLSIAVSFIISTGLNQRIHPLYMRFYHRLRRFKSEQLEVDLPDCSNTRIIVLGMGNIGSGAYETLQQRYGSAVLGVDDNDRKLKSCRARGQRVVGADASDPLFWSQVRLDEVEQVLLALTNHGENMLVGALLRDMGYAGKITAIVRYAEEAADLEKYDIASFDLYAEAGSGFANHAQAALAPREESV
ncbi:MAG: cation:proton antiporter family protein [Halieaceae bacterium]|nr:cation:proton antiporter family protein [Halieaceae bacterium]